MPQSGTLLTSTEAGAIIGISGKTVVRRARSGDIPYVHQLPGPNGAMLFDADVIRGIKDVRDKARAA